MPHYFGQLSRREVILVALAALQMEARPTCAQGLRSSAGCFVAYNAPPQGSSTADPCDGLINTSGDEQFDQELRRGRDQIESEFEVRPRFYYYSGGNAWASSKRCDKGSDGTVRFGLELLREVQMIRHSMAAALAICAHEYAHIYQFGHIELYRRLQNNLPSFCRELHADFMAGYFLRLYRNVNPSINEEVVRQQFESMGGSMSDYIPEDFHGTKQQRCKAVVAGYVYAEQNARDLQAAAEQAYNHASSPD